MCDHVQGSLVLAHVRHFPDVRSVPNPDWPPRHAVLSNWPPLERVATELNDDVSSQPTNAARRWASTSIVVLGSAGN
jgi:hypothetical protein